MNQNSVHPKELRFSVFIAAHNQACFLDTAIESVLNQNYPKELVQIILVDDGSTDETAQLLKKYQDRILIVHKNQGGQASAWNTAFPKTQGDIIAFLDADDFWYPEKLRGVATAFQNNERLDAIYHSVHFADKTGLLIGSYPNKRLQGGVKKIPYDLSHFLAGELAYFAPSSGICLRRNCLEKMMPVPERFRICADGYLQMLIPFHAREFKHLPEYLGVLRLHGANSWMERIETPEVIQQQIAMEKQIMAVLDQEASRRQENASGIKRRMEIFIAESEIRLCALTGKKIEGFQKVLALPRRKNAFYDLFRRTHLLLSLLLPYSLYISLRKKYQEGPLLSLAQRIFHP